MSGIFGIFNRNGKEVDKEMVNTMLDAISYWDPDERDTRVNGEVALGHTMLWNTPESQYEHLPVQKETYILTMDARIDNRDELLKEIDLPDRPLEEIGDSEFILAAYLKWGEDCPKHLLGDFTFAIWDDNKQHLFCACDHIGIKQFYYYLDDDIFIFSNDMEGITSYPYISDSFDEASIAALLKDHGLLQQNSTFFKNIKKLSAATTLIVTNKNLHENEFWKIENSPSIIYETDDEYIKELKKLFESAINVRMRTIFPIASHLSGGLDSSSIAVYASRKLMKKNQKIYAYNWLDIPDYEDKYEYEAWSFSRKIAENENIIHEEFRVDPSFLAKQLKEHNVLTKSVIYYWQEYFIQDAIEKIGARTLLSGWGGDELISINGNSYIVGLFQEGKIYTAFKYLYIEKNYSKQTWNKFIIRILSIMKSLCSLKCKRINNIDDQSIYDYYKYTSEEFSHYMQNHKTKEFPRVVGVKKRQLALFYNGHLADRIDAWTLSGIAKKIEYRYPLLDKRIVEFAMGIPEEKFYPSKGIHRYLFSSVVEDYLPIEMAWFPKTGANNVSKSHTKFHFDALRIMQKELMNINCDTFNQDYIDCEKIKEELKNFDFDAGELSQLENITPAILLMYSIHHLRLKKKL